MGFFGHQARLGPRKRSDQSADHLVGTVGPPYKSYLINKTHYLFIYTHIRLMGFWGFGVMYVVPHFIAKYSSFYRKKFMRNGQID